MRKSLIKPGITTPQDLKTAFHEMALMRRGDSFLAHLLSDRLSVEKPLKKIKRFFYIRISKLNF